MRCTERQLLAYLLIHPDFSGLTISEAAKLMSIGKRAVYKLLQRFQKNCPQAFQLIYTNPPTYSWGRIDYIEERYKIREKF